jgi:hypothetical protein
MAAQFEWDRQYAKTHYTNGTAKGTGPVRMDYIPPSMDYIRPAAPKAPAPAAPVTAGATNADRRDFEESVDRMRRLSNMLKG